MSDKQKRIHLVCNAHLDPAWQWQWEDGLTETLATFRVACEFCESEKGFIFCHNEAVLYKWVEDYDPKLFQRIQKHVKAKRWHIVGGSFLQPDLNAPCGESLIRQYLLGQNYLSERFGVRPKATWNVDSFGQPEGYPQILAGCGYDAYMFMRPCLESMDLPIGAFRWRDRSGSEVIGRRLDDTYVSGPEGFEIYNLLNKYTGHYGDEPEIMVLWGLGNHGGGASRSELAGIRRFAKEKPEYELVHSAPENYFDTVLMHKNDLPVVSGELQNVFPGCYSSMARVKRLHRETESLYYIVERMAAQTWHTGTHNYPQEDLTVALKDILFSQFHDIITGSGVASVEKDSLGLLHHARENLRRIRSRVFLSMLQKEKRADDDDVPVFVWNPHGFEVTENVDCEFSFTRSYIDTEYSHSVRDGHTGKLLPFHKSVTESPFAYHWRCKINVPLTLKPFECRRLEISSRPCKAKPKVKQPRPTRKNLDLLGKKLRTKINSATGLVDFLAPCGERNSYLKRGALELNVFQDRDHSWNCGAPDFDRSKRANEFVGSPWKTPKKFRLATSAEAGRIVQPPGKGGAEKLVNPRVAPVRIIESSPLRTVVEAVFVYKSSWIIRQYIINKSAPWLEVMDRVFWAEPMSMLKTAVPYSRPLDHTISETLYSTAKREVPAEHVESQNHSWVSGIDKIDRCVTVLNSGNHGHSVDKNTLHISLVRSPAYCAFDLRPELPAHSDRYWPRMDMGEHVVRYRIMPTKRFSESKVSEAAQLFNMPPQWIVFYPDKKKKPTPESKPWLTVSPGNIQIAAVKKEENGDGLVVRLRELAGRKTRARVTMVDAKIEIDVPPYSLATVLIRRKSGQTSFLQTNLVERRITK